MEVAFQEISFRKFALLTSLFLVFIFMYTLYQKYTDLDVELWKAAGDMHYIKNITFCILQNRFSGTINQWTFCVFTATHQKIFCGAFDLYITHFSCFLSALQTCCMCSQSWDEMIKKRKSLLDKATRGSQYFTPVNKKAARFSTWFSLFPLCCNTVSCFDQIITY